MIITSKTPRLDLHGEIAAMVEVLVNEFIHDNILMKNDCVVIIHGRSSNILAKEVHNVLKKNKYVVKYYINNWNVGETIVELNFV